MVLWGTLNQALIIARLFPRYLHSTGGMLGEGTAACDDDGIDFCTSSSSTASAASAICKKIQNYSTQSTFFFV